MLQRNHFARLTIALSIAVSALPSLAANHNNEAQEMPTAASISKKWNAEESLLIEMSRQVALTLKRDGFEAYSNLFHPEYSNWFMGVLPVRNRTVFLRDIKQWFDAGNYAVASDIEPISVDIDGDTAHLRLKQTEHFTDAKGTPSSFSFHGVHMMKKVRGQWRFYASSFTEEVKQ